MSDMSSFRNWFMNPKERNKREIAMERHGIPHEIKTRRTLTSLGYQAFRSTYWVDDPRMTGDLPELNPLGREIDFEAQKVIGNCTLPHDIKLDFSLRIVGECKRSNVRDFFLFRADDDIVTYVFGMARYPIPLFAPVPECLDINGSLSRYFSFDYFVDRIVEVDTRSDHFESMEDNNYNDTITYDACEKLLDASEHLGRIGSNDYSRETMLSKLRPLIETCTDKPDKVDYRDGANASGIAQQLLKQWPREVWEIFKNTVGSGAKLTFQVPMLVIDDNRSLVKTTVSQRGGVTFDEETDIAVYLHLSRYPMAAYQTGFIEGGSPVAVFPVILCLNRGLDEAIRKLEDGTRRLIEKFNHEIEKDPEIIPAEFIRYELMMSSAKARGAHFFLPTRRSVRAHRNNKGH